jgi:hypothetical protein
MGGGGQFLTLQLKNEETNINMHAKQIDDFEPYNICVGHADKIENVGTRLFCYRSHIDINKIGSDVNKYEYCSCRIISTKLVIICLAWHPQKSIIIHKVEIRKRLMALV